MVYAKGKSVFELIDPDGHIYVLQAHDAQFPIESLAKLGEQATAQGLAIPHASPDRRPGAGPRTRQNYAVGDEFHQYWVVAQTAEKFRQAWFQAFTGLVRSSF